MSDCETNLNTIATKSTNIEADIKKLIEIMKSLHEKLVGTYVED